MKKTLKIHLLNIADDIRKNWWVLLLSVLLGLMAAYIYENNGWSQSNRGEYSATVRIYDRNSQVSNIWKYHRILLLFLKFLISILKKS